LTRLSDLIPSSTTIRSIYPSRLLSFSLSLAERYIDCCFFSKLVEQYLKITILSKWLEKRHGISRRRVVFGSIMVRQATSLITAALFVFPVVNGQGNRDLFQFGYDDDENGMGQPNWGRVQCRDINTCVSTVEDTARKTKTVRFHYFVRKSTTRCLMNTYNGQICFESCSQAIRKTSPQSSATTASFNGALMTREMAACGVPRVVRKTVACIDSPQSI
jgi:hypothetical protein